MPRSNLVERMRRLIRLRNPAHQAGVERLLPVASGAGLGLATLFFLPCSSRSEDFFSVAAQVIPVLLLALAIETRVFGVRGASQGDTWSRWLDGSRLVLSVALLVMFIWAEWGALSALADESEVDPSWPQNIALTWGVMTVGAIALTGVGRPRLEASIKWSQGPGFEVLLEAGASNRYGDRDVTPLMNLLLPEDLLIFHSDPYAKFDPDQEQVPVRPLPEPDGIVNAGNYIAERVLVTAGDATARSFLLHGVQPGRKYGLILRFDHSELRTGRVAAEVWIELAEPGGGASGEASS